MVPKANFVWADTGSFRIMVHGEEPPTDEEWARFMAETMREVDGRLVAAERKGAVIYSLGGMATPRQRRQLQRLDLTNRRPPTLVLMSDSRFARGVATALGWLLPSLRSFHALALHQVDEAAAILSAHVGERAEFKQVLAALLRELDVGDMNAQEPPGSKAGTGLGYSRSERPRPKSSAR